MSDLDNEELEATRDLKVNSGIKNLKSLLYANNLTQYGKRRLIKYYEDEINRQKQINKEYQKKIAELKEYIFIAPNLDEMTATKYVNIQKEAYTKGGAEEQQRAEYIIYKNFIPKQKIKDKIEEFKNENYQIALDSEVAFDTGIMKNNLKIQVLEELLQESEDK